MYVVRGTTPVGTQYLVEASKDYPCKYRWDKKAKSASKLFTRSTARRWAERMGGTVVKL
jgi:hypothetical protein